MHYRYIFAVLSLLSFVKGIYAEDDNLLTCKLNKNFYKKVNELIDVKLQKYDGSKDMARFEKFMKEVNEREEKRAKEIVDLKDRIHKLEIETGISSRLTDCPTSGQSGEYRLYSDEYPQGLKVYCDTETDGGGWLVFQRRKNGKVNFDREWSDYVQGFGTLSEEFWLGLGPLTRVLGNGEYELRIDLQDWDKNKVFAVYRVFSIGNEESNYTLTVAEYSGTAGDSLTHHSGAAFSTKDRDNDKKVDGNCAKNLKRAWWFTNCNLSNLNGKYYKNGHYSVGIADPIDGVSWYYWKNTKLYSMKITEMKIRKKMSA